MKKMNVWNIIINFRALRPEFINKTSFLGFYDPMFFTLGALNLILFFQNASYILKYFWHRKFSGKFMFFI